MPRGVELVETPVAKLDTLALANELLEQRHQELDTLQHQLTLLEARVASEKAAWSQQKADLEQEMALRSRQLSEQWAAKLEEADRILRAHQQSLGVQQAIEQEAERRMQEITRKEAALADLSRERVEVEQLRRQVQTRSDQVEASWSESHASLLKGQAALKEAEKLQAAVQTRTEQLNSREAEVTKREQEVVAREKHLAIVQAQVEEQLTRLATEEEPHARDSAGVGQPGSSDRSETAGIEGVGGAG